MLAVLAAMVAIGTAPALPVSAAAIRAPLAAERAWHPDVKAARRYALGRHGSVSFAVRAQDADDARVRVWGFRQDRTERSASVVKAMLLMSYLKRPDVRGRALTEDERELLSPMIRWSSNDAATMVMNMLGEERVERDARRWGMTHFEVRRPWGACRITARDQARFWLRFDRLLPRRHRQFGLALTRQIIPGQRWGIARVSPRHWTLHFKGGWGSGVGLVDHQAALLTRGRLHVSVVILTANQDSHVYGQETLRGVAARLVRGLAAFRPDRG